MLVLDKNYMQMTMGIENAVICALLLRCRKKRRRKTWVHPLVNRRLLNPFRSSGFNTKPPFNSRL